ncbi:hypothetical protein [Capnocytophaga canimorsus]|uniref:hypothetical protein n=1 Tax=Capnocytophaga canimorsus TaxID=28188 RepID=UPI0028E1A274|nr:hypothetical protein [Capnocytophaga canimorsus]MDT9498437.1 hypothetical protein [Capnocytophaga canimorsus]
MEKYNLNNIYVIECVDKNESTTMGAKALYEDVINRIKYNNSDIETNYYSVDTKIDFLNTLDNILKKEIQEKSVLLHIYIHGSKENGLQTNDEEFTSWKELREKFRKINIKTKNRLFVVLANCHGSYIGLDIGSELDKKSPFNSLISSQYEEKVSDINELFLDFYEKIFKGGNVVEGFCSVQNDKKFYFKNIKSFIEFYLECKKNDIGNKDYGIKILREWQEKINDNFLFSEDRINIIK